MKIHYFISAFLVTLSWNGFAQIFSSKYFTIERLDHGIYAAISKNGGHAICNAGIIDLGDAVLVFDPFMTPEGRLFKK